MLATARRALRPLLCAVTTSLEVALSHAHARSSIQSPLYASGQQRWFWLTGSPLYASGQQRWFWLTGSQQQQQQHVCEPPWYPQRPHSYRLGHLTINDEYWWLTNYEQAKHYLRQEQQYFADVSRLWSQQAQQLLQEMKQHVAAVQHSEAPETVGQYEYWTDYNPHGQDTIMRRCLNTGQQQVILSAQSLQEDAAVLRNVLSTPVSGDHVGGVKLSQDQQMMAYAVSMVEGAERYCCVVKHINTGRLLTAGIIPHVTSFEWSGDGSCLYYCLSDDLGRPSKVYRRRLDAISSGGDTALFSEADPKYFVTLTRTKDWRYVLINSHSKLSSEVHLLDAQDDHSMPVCVQARTPGLEYFVDHYKGHLLLLTNKSGASTAAALHAAGAAANTNISALVDQDYCLMTILVSQVVPGHSCSDNWQLLVHERPDTAVTDMDVFESGIVLHELVASRPALTLLRLEAEQQTTEQPGGLRVLQQQQVPFPDWVFCARPGINQDYHATHMRMYLSSPVTPEVQVDLDLARGQLEQHQQRGQRQHLPHQPQKLQDSKPAAQHAPMVCKRLWAAAADGVQVPMTLLRQEGLPYNGQQPLLLEVYGAYGQVLEADYKAFRLPLLQRGWSVALAHVRGGGELGRRWHSAGRQLHKPKSVTDLLACMKLLVDVGATSYGRFAAHSVSAGGLTLAAAVNHKPRWFSSVVLEAPFVDWAGAMGVNGEDELLSEHETDEWGDPQQDARVAEIISSMCPHNNLAHNMEYPAMLVSAGLVDNRVPYWMAAKYVAKLRTIGADRLQNDRDARQHSQMALLQFDEGAGHFSRGYSGGHLDDMAQQYAFLLYVDAHRCRMSGSTERTVGDDSVSC